MTTTTPGGDGEDISGEMVCQQLQGVKKTLAIEQYASAGMPSFSGIGWDISVTLPETPKGASFLGRTLTKAPNFVIHRQHKEPSHQHTMMIG